MRYLNSHPIADQREHECLKFYPRNMPAASELYVCWIDVMGSKEAMLDSLYIASNFIMKLHMAALRVAEVFAIDLYPAIDGVYACSPSRRSMASFLNRVYSTLATTFIREEEERFKFQVRSGLAYGQVVMGGQVIDCADDDILRNHSRHTKSVLLGSALTHAYEAERKAPPFGIALDKSAVNMAEEVSPSENYLKWWESHARKNDRALACELYLSLKSHYMWCYSKSERIRYPKDDIRRHEASIDEYFSEFRRRRFVSRRFMS
jgi:hypothetical protein